MGILYRSINESDADPVVLKAAVLLPGPRLQNISELLLQRQNSSGYQATWILSKYSDYIIEFVTLMQKFKIYHFVILKESFCVYFTGITNLCQTEDMVLLTYILWAELTVLDSIGYFILTLSWQRNTLKT